MKQFTPKIEWNIIWVICIFVQFEGTSDFKIWWVQKEDANTANIFPHSKYLTPTIFPHSKYPTPTQKHHSIQQDNHYKKKKGYF